MIERFETFTTNIASIYKNIVKIKKYEMNKIGLKGTHVTCMNFLNNSPKHKKKTQQKKQNKKNQNTNQPPRTGAGRICQCRRYVRQAEIPCQSHPYTQRDFLCSKSKCRNQQCSIFWRLRSFRRNPDCFLFCIKNNFHKLRAILRWIRKEWRAWINVKLHIAEFFRNVLK